MISASKNLSALSLLLHCPHRAWSVYTQENHLPHRCQRNKAGFTQLFKFQGELSMHKQTMQALFSQSMLGSLETRLAHTRHVLARRVPFLILSKSSLHFVLLQVLIVRAILPQVQLLKLLLSLAQLLTPSSSPLMLTRNYLVSSLYGSCQSYQVVMHSIFRLNHILKMLHQPLSSTKCTC